MKCFMNKLCCVKKKVWIIYEKEVFNWLKEGPVNYSNTFVKLKNVTPARFSISRLNEDLFFIITTYNEIIYQHPMLLGFQRFSPQ